MRLAFLALLVGGLLAWNQWRKPRALVVELDLTSALPGEIREIDLVVRRHDRLLGRREIRFEGTGAPQILSTEIQATPGEAELEADLIYRARAPGNATATTRAHAHVLLSADAPARAVADAPARSP